MKKADRRQEWNSSFNTGVLDPSSGSRYARMAWVVQLTVILLGFLTTAYGNGMGHGELSPKAEALRRGCDIDADCGGNEYCGGRSGRCLKCFECSWVKRKSKQSYDGELCAKHQSDCGECYDDYKEIGGVCVPKTSIQSPTPQIVPNHKKTAFEQNLEEDVNEASSVVIVGIVVFIILLLVGVLLFVSCVHRKQKQSRDPESAVLCATASDKPSAPPSEYGLQPPEFNPLSSSMTNTIVNRALFNAKTSRNYLQEALPFQRGNAMHEWEVDPNETSDEPDSNQNLPETGSTVDPIQHQEPSTSNAGPIAPTPRVGTQDLGGAAAADSHLASGPPNESAPRPGTSNDPILGILNIQLWIENHVLGRVFRGEMNPMEVDPGTLAQPRMIYSAPPSPRRIDDTYLGNLLELQGQFQQPFNRSIDSGTGTDERQVPSRSISGSNIGGPSDNEDSLYGDPLASPASPSVVPVPDFQYQDDDQDEYMDIEE